MSADQVDYFSEARRELEDAFEWCLERSLQAAEAFVRETDRAVGLIAGGTAKTTRLNIIARSKYPDIANAERARRLATWALSTFDSASSFDVLQVTLVYGDDIGIAESWRSHEYSHPPAEWRAR